MPESGWSQADRPDAWCCIVRRRSLLSCPDPSSWSLARDGCRLGQVKLSTFLPMLPVTFTLSSSLDHAENKANFGMGISLGQ